MKKFVSIMTTVAFIKIEKLTKIICVLDTASATTTIDKDFAEAMNIPLEDHKTKEFIYMDRKAEMKTAKCNIELLSQDKKTSFKLECTAIEGFSKNCCVWPWSTFKNNHEHLKEINIPTYPEPLFGRILIGVDNPDMLVITEYKRSKDRDRPMAAMTPLGWAFLRPDPPGDYSNNIYSFQDSKILADMIARQFEIENIGAKEPCQPYKMKMVGPKDPNIWTPGERLADALMEVKLFKKTHPYLEAKIPWKKGHSSKLRNNSRAISTRQARTHTVEALNKKGILMDEINTTIEKYLEKDYIEIVNQQEVNQGWYLPFFEVVNRHKSTPIRLVFDAKAKFKDTSLNQQIMDTPNRLNDITVVLTRMRRHKFIFAGDISEMFLQIKLNESDREFHRFTHNGCHYQFKRILFGNKASPNISQKATLCSSYEEFTEAITTLTKSCYMDDCIDSRNTEKGVKNVSHPTTNTINSETTFPHFRTMTRPKQRIKASYGRWSRK